MVTKEHEARQRFKHRAVYNDWGLYGFVQMLEYKCLLAGKDTHQTRRTRYEQDMQRLWVQATHAALQAHVSLWILRAGHGPG